MATAFWINAYNAVTVKGILREYPHEHSQSHGQVHRIQHLKNLKLHVGGKQVSLDDMEHQILRKWVNRGSISRLCVLRLAPSIVE